MRQRRKLGRGGCGLLAGAWLLLAGGATARAQEAPAGPPPNAVEVQKQLQELRNDNRKLQSRLDALSIKYEALSSPPKPAASAESAGHDPLQFNVSPDAALTPGGPAEALLEPSWPLIPGQRRAGSGSNLTGTAAAPRTTSSRTPMYQIGLLFWRDDSREFAGRDPYRPDMPPAEHEIGEGVGLGGPENGLTWHSKDKYFSMTFHNLTQMDLREPIQQGDPLHGGFIIPRQRWYFEGKVGDYANFVTSVNRGYASLDLLDSYVDYIVNPEWLQFRVGRMKTPSQYEYIAVDEANLIGPERSLYVQSFAGNRQLGVMAHGQLFDRKLEYYAGVFNGQRRSFEDFNSARDYYFYMEYRPFRDRPDSHLQGLHLVGAYNFGQERNPLTPFALRTMNQLSGSDAAAFVSPTILEFAPNAFENGPRQFWSFESVYYHRSWGFLSGFQGGYQDYSTTSAFARPVNFQNAANEFLSVRSFTRTHVPITGWSAQAWWFITGEEITRRRFLVEPRRPFGYYNGTINPGAIELFTKVSNLQVSSDVFRAGLVDPTLWANQATAFEVGFNWYLNHFVKFAFDYQHVFLNKPVILNPAFGQFTDHYDLFLCRTQLFF